MTTSTALITGAGGWTAKPILDRLHASGYRLIGLDVQSHDPSDLHKLRWVKADVGEPAAIEAACSSEVTAIVHFAIAVGANDYAGPEAPFRTNVLGTYNVFEAARRAGVNRVVLVSSAAVHLPSKKIDSSTGWKSDAGTDHLHDLTKRLQEEIARDFAQTFDIDAIVLRAGHIVDAREQRDPRGSPLEGLRYCRGGWLCRHDLAAAVERALETSLSGLHVFNIIGSGSARARFDVGEAEAQLGFTIQERFERYEP